ncbi:deoxyribodipyrimidine photolyase [Planctomycetes bacterium Poly30]|uniref:Deoxyribodipyrimidine photo-lyase n=1 Tax=Saltatorellus ferox TaxID=2528018 RepID=A0A518EPH3_9BACT|nr:deoxyribodipyrimidine photolyase [Planctomycetes bacterium Poly30]
MLAPDSRLAVANDKPVREDGRYVVYWMIAQRRTRYHFGLQHALQRARDLEVPLVVVEALSCSYRWASDRMHSFAIDGMREQQGTFESTPIEYYPYVEPEKDAGQGLHEALAKEACLYVTDHWPCFHLPKWVDMVASAIDVRMETVDSCGILPVRSIEKPFARAHDFRRQMHRDVHDALLEMPLAYPLKGSPPPDFDGFPAGFEKKFPRTDLEALDLADLPIDHDVPPVENAPGGQTEGLRRLDRFIEERLQNYLDRNQPEADAASGLSPWLHWGHVSAHEVFQRVADEEGWDPSAIEGQKATGKREGWWGMSAAAEGFLDELITWREVCFNTCQNRPKDYGKYESLPDFAKKTLAEHADDKRPHVYSLEEFEKAKTHDELWNAAQNQLRRDGIIHNYLRMLWGKKILHWAESPQEAHRIMVELNNKYGLDGRDPNSWGGIMWTLGRYDRAWGPEREIFGKVRYMTSDNTARKVRVKNYVSKYASTGSLFE